MSFKSLAAIDWICLTYLSGTILSLLFLHTFPLSVFLSALIILLTVTVAFRREGRTRTTLLLLFVFFLSLFRTAGSFDDNFAPGVKTLSGYVSEPPLLREKSQSFRLQTTSGQIAVTTEKFETYNYGERLGVAGDFRKVGNEVKVGYPKIFRREGQGGNPLFAGLFDWREKFRETLKSIFPEPEGSLAQGILLGTASIKDRGFLESLRITGTSHIVTVSGYNISTIINVVIISLSLVPTKLVFLPLLLIVLLFDLLAGFSAPVLRATLMGLALFGARLLGRQRNSTDALLLSAALIAFFDPRSLSSVSFQLSFLATAGLIFLYPWLRRVFDSWPPAAAQPLAATLAAQLAVLPVVIYHFGTLSLIAPLANVLVGWTVPALMALTFLTGFFGQIFWPLGQAVGALDLVLLTYFVRMIDLLARIPWASIQL